MNFMTQTFDRIEDNVKEVSNYSVLFYENYLFSTINNLFVGYKLGIN